jgi:hypothetical protein
MENGSSAEEIRRDPSNGQQQRAQISPSEFRSAMRSI